MSTLPKFLKESRLLGMIIRENEPLSKHTTLRIGGPARYFVEAKNEDDVLEAIKLAHEKGLPIFVMGAGSNLLVADSGFPGVILKFASHGIEIVRETDSDVFIKVASGELLDTVVAWTVGREYWGMENLSFVPGTIGGFVIQNAGCYGADASQVIESVTILDRKTFDRKILSHDACKFSYRKSVFLTDEGADFVVLSAVIHLRKKGFPNLTYADLAQYFIEVHSPTQSQVRKAVTEIRKRKGQDWVAHPSAGSFFKNPRLTKDEYTKVQSVIEQKLGAEARARLEQLLAKMYARQGEEDFIKIPLGFVMDKLLGMKGRTVGGAKLSELQVINIVNTGTATADDVMALFKQVKEEVFEKTGIVVENEPEFVGF